MTVHLRTRVELTCWNLIIPAMTKLRYIRSTPQAEPARVLTKTQFMVQVLIASVAGLVIGLVISVIQAKVW